MEKDIQAGIRNRVLAVSGSPRKGGNSDILMKELLEGVKDRGMSCEGINLTDYHVHPCVGCEGCRKTGMCVKLKDGMQLLYPKIIESKGLILISPTHNYNITAWMKAFIDRLYCFYVFSDQRPRGWKSRLSGQGRKAVVAAVCEQESREDMGFTLEAMKRPISALGYDVIDELAVFGTFDRGKVAKDKSVMQKARDLGATLASSVEQG